MRLTHLIVGLLAVIMPLSAAAQNTTPPTATLGSYIDRSGLSRPLDALVMTDINGVPISTWATGTANGQDVAEGNTNDAAWSGSGACTVISCLKYIGIGSTPTGANVVGRYLPAFDADARGGASPVASTVATGAQVLKASAGNLYGLNAATGGTAGYVLVFNSTTVPADGTVTPAKCYALAANSSLEITRSTATYFSAGISVAFSTTGCFTKTVSATAFISGDVK